MVTHLVRAGVLAVLTAGLAGAVGCNEPKPAAKTEDKKEKAGGHEWWCDEHGVPEDECSICSDKAYKQFKEKGDVCPKHPDRAASQCFICNPELWEKSAARYKAKTGKEAPWPENNAPPKK
jgi:hypothetical protein